MSESVDSATGHGLPSGDDGPHEGSTADRTGDAVVDAALDRLAAVAQAGLDDQVRVLADVHEVLQQRLSASTP